MQNNRRQAIYILSLALCTFLSYANTFDVPFHFDDFDNIVNNPAIKKFDYFTDISKLDRPDIPDAFDRPLFRTRYFGYLTFAVNHALHGLEVWGYHLANLLVHLFSALLVYLLVALTFRAPRMLPDGDPSQSDRDSRDVIAFFSALLFAVHPIQTQAVTYIVQRFASLATLLILLSLFSYARFRIAPGTTGRFHRACLYALSLLCGVMAMKTKEFGLLAPLLIALYDSMFLEGGIKKRVLLIGPFFVSMLVVPLSLVATSGGGISDSAAKISGAQGTIGRLDYLFTQFRVVMTYLRLLFFPVNQRFDYDYPIYRSFLIPEVALSAFILLLMFLSGFYLCRLSRDLSSRDRHLYRLIAFGIFWFFLTISAESSIIPIADVIFEHRMYLPSIGLILAVVSVVYLLGSRYAMKNPFVPKLVTYAMLMLALMLLVATYARNNIWRDRVGLLENEVRLTPKKARPRATLASVYAMQGRLEEAVINFRQVIADNPGYADAYYSLGLTYATMGRVSEAVNEFQRAIGLRFMFPDAHAHLGAAYAKIDRLDDAVQEYRIALMMKPQSAEIRNNLGNALNRQGRREEAVQEYLHALRINPAFAEANYNLGRVYAEMGRMDDAVRSFREALRLKADFPAAERQLEQYLRKDK